MTCVGELSELLLASKAAGMVSSSVLQRRTLLARRSCTTLPRSSCGIPSASTSRAGRQQGSNAITWHFKCSSPLQRTTSLDRPRHHPHGSTTPSDTNQAQLIALHTTITPLCARSNSALDCALTIVLKHLLEDFASVRFPAAL
jgi:hypothetical protein